MHVLGFVLVAASPAQAIANKDSINAELWRCIGGSTDFLAMIWRLPGKGFTWYD